MWKGGVGEKLVVGGLEPTVDQVVEKRMWSLALVAGIGFPGESPGRFPAMPRIEGREVVCQFECAVGPICCGVGLVGSGSEFRAALFCVRPAGRTDLLVKVQCTPGKGKC